MNVAGKVALVTGASRGVGRATAKMLAHKGAAVVVNYCRSAEAAEELVGVILADGGQAIAVGGNVADDADCRAIVDRSVGEFGRLDILVNNAGTTRFVAHSDLESVTDEVWDDILGVNLRGPFQCIRAALPHLKKSGSAEVVNVASVAGITFPGSSVPYGASKAALIKMTIDLARALGPEVRMNAVAPGFIAGEWLQAGLGDRYENVKASVENASTLGKVCEPEDVAAAIVSLIEGSDLVTGQTLTVDGGMTLGPRVL